ncbi:hypothetical protein NA57DRAFT_76469 [Rhizodiscina lignyota]|uniref:BTB domain-containing protein n=1 Tax=Rhizodiscina lignyota TaxID=1504668 RepID=A0A9P4IE71_9PEZI|nr:hypothetical protein NA57DRAFT_76469 [Rhizodiscina lignyota]
MNAPPSFLTHELTIVTVLVGSEKKPFYLYKEVLCHHSEYFRNAFNGEFREASKRELVLDDTNVETFRYVAQWLHDQGNNTPLTRQYWVFHNLRLVDNLKKHTSAPLATHSSPDSQNSNGNDEGVPMPSPSSLASAAAENLLNLYIFADRYDIRELRNDIMDVWRYEEIASDPYPDPGLDNNVFLRAILSTPSQSTLRRYLLKRHATSINWHTATRKKWLGEIWDQLPSDFTLDFLCMQSAHVKASKRPLYKDFWEWCNYHEHESDQESTECALEVSKLRTALETLGTLKRKR